MYETTGTLDESLLRALGRHLLPPGQRLLFVLISTLALLIAALDAWWGDRRSACFFLALLVILVIEHVLLQRKIIRVDLARLRETTGEPSARYTTRLEADGVLTQNHSTGGSVTIHYEQLVQLVKTPSADVLFTKARQIIPLFHAGLTPEQQTARRAFLREKPTKLRRF